MSEFPVHLEFGYANELKGMLVKRLEFGEEIRLDFGDVQRASLACIQVLLAARAQAEKNQIGFVVEASDQFKNILQHLGLQEELLS